MKKRDRDNEDAICAMCEHGTPIFTGDTVLCRRRGLVRANGCCRKWRFDPLKRSVKPTPPIPTLDPHDIVT